MSWYIAVLKKYAVFSGRARRKEYWMFFLINFIFTGIAMILDNVFGIAFEHLYYGPIYMLYGLAMFIPSLAVVVRRFHDTGKSGWFILISLIPLIGAIWFIILMVRDSEPGENQYGANPKT